MDNSKTYNEFFEKMIKPEMENKDMVVDHKNKNCIDCDDCCGMFTLITQSEFDDLNKYFRKNKIGKIIYKKAVDRVLSFNAEFPDAVYLKCPLLNRKKKCEIYNNKNRPSICKEFHCSKELNSLDDKFDGRTNSMFELFREDLLKNKSFEKKVRLLSFKLQKDVLNRGI